jgi:hypothetical protein
MPQNKPADPEDWIKQQRQALDPDAWMHAQMSEDVQGLPAKLQIDPAFQALTPEQKTTYVMTRLHGPQAMPPAGAPATIPGRVMSGAARGLTELGGAIKGGYEALTGLPEGLSQAFGPQPPPTPEEEAELRKPPPALGQLIKPENISVLGPMGKQYGEAFGRDPAEATGRAGFDALTYLLGMGGKAAGARAAEETAAAEAAAATRGIPGAPATAMEARRGTIPGASRAIAMSPIGESRVVALAAQRQPVFQTAIERLMPSVSEARLAEEQAALQGQALRAKQIAEARALRERYGTEDVARAAAEQQAAGALKEKHLGETAKTRGRFTQEDVARTEAERQAAARSQAEAARESTGLESELQREADERAARAAGILPGRAEQLAPGVTRETAGPAGRAAIGQRVARTPQQEAIRMLTEGTTQPETQAVARTVEQLPALPRRGGRVETSRIPNIGQMEKDYWNAVDQRAREVGGATTLPNATRAAASEGPVAVESWQRIASNLSPSTQAILRKLSPQVESALEQLGSRATTAAERENFLRLLGEAPSAQPVSWDALRQGRTEIGDLLQRARRENVLGSNETRVLRKIRDALTSDMRQMISSDPALTSAFDAANQLTRYKQQIYGKGPVEKMLRASREPGAIEQSEIIQKIPSMTREEASAVHEALGPNPQAQRALKAGILDDLMTKATSKTGKFDQAAAIKLLEEKAGYRAILGDAETESLKSQLSEGIERGKLAVKEAEGLKEAVKGERERVGLEEAARKAQEAARVTGQRRAELGRIGERQRAEAAAETARKTRETADIATKRRAETTGMAERFRTEREALKPIKNKAQAQGALRDLFQRSTKGVLGDPDAIFDGPGFASRWKNARSKFVEAGLDPKHIEAIDDFAKDASELSLSKKAAAITPGPGYGGYFTMGTILTGIGGALAGRPGIAAGAGAVLGGEKLLMRIMMQPEGPRLLSRAMKLQKLGKPLGEVADALAKLAIVAPKEEVDTSK